MFRRLIAWLFFKMGWKVQTDLPKIPKYILIAAPHTSNWDFVIGIMARVVVQENIHFLGKHQLFLPPWGWIFRALGGSPVIRTQTNNLVQTAITEFQQRETYKLALAPEGTRSPVTRWKMGFYHIAKAAKVPIVCIGFDFKHKEIVIREPMMTSNDMVSDMNQILNFYRTVHGRYPKSIPTFEAKN